MKHLFQISLVAIVSLCWFSLGAAQESLNQVKIGTCSNTGQVEQWSTDEEKRGLVIDSRPFAINQSTGKLLFTGKTGRVSVVHMNPLVYEYRISVAQQELISTAVSDFLPFILPPSLAKLKGLESGDIPTPESRKAQRAGTSLLEQRLDAFDRTKCTVDPAACDATEEMSKAFKKIQASLKASENINKLETSPIIGEFATYSDLLTKARDQQLKTSEACERAQALDQELTATPVAGNKVYKLAYAFKDLDAAQAEIAEVLTLVAELQQLVTNYNGDTGLASKVVRCNGFNCTNQFQEYVNVVRALLGGYQRKLDNLRGKNQEMQNTWTLTQRMRDKEGLFARTFTVIKKFELSEATIAVKRDPLEAKSPDNKVAATQSGTVTTNPNNNASPPANTEGTLGNQFGPSFVPGTQSGSSSNNTPAVTTNAATQPANATPLVGDVNEVIQIGRPRFMLSAGMVYSPLPRRTFQVVKGFALDAQGNPTGNGDANVVGFDQNSPRRLFPMMFLNSRLLDYGQGSLYFSLGVTGKHDNNVDLEYLLGPSVSFLNDRALFTFGAYGGLTQNLVSDVKIGDVIPDGLGSDVALFRKSLTWKPGFSFSYSLSSTKKRDTPAASGGTASAANELKNEIRIGSVPFNLALGLAYTSLEQRTYDEIAGFARNREGGLTNGQTLARIVGVTSSSDYRLSPLLMLHSRLTRFGAHDFYFTSGITGKKTDNDFDVEYLLGGSVNVYRRKVFLTFGSFVGKQQLLGANFFEGAALPKGQTVTTEKRYVWKPAIAFSYDISRIIPR